LYAAIYAPILRNNFQGKILYRSHNIEHKIWEGLAKNQRNPLKKWYLQQLTKSLKREEYAIWDEVDTILSISKEDKAFIQQKTQSKVNYLPSSIPIQNKQIHWNTNRLCFIGAFDWEPNLEAIKWFLKDVFPIVKQNFPTIEFHIAGRKCERIPEEWRQDRVNIHGFVEDPLAFMAENGLFVACLQSGSGIKMKVLEAMSIGAPCVLTTKAAEGLALSAKIPIHEDAMSYALDIIELLQDENKQELRGALGKLYISSEFSTQMVKEILEKDLQAMASI
jgi:glycosyltransferase involved in cell wall biosynthesis